MFKNVGGKIKGLAMFNCVLGIIISIISGIMLSAYIEDMVEGYTLPLLCGALVMIIGCLFSWLSVLLLYAFGQLVENSDICARYAKQIAKKDF